MEIFGKEFIVESFSVTETKTGKPMGKIKLKYGEDFLNGVVWQEILEKTPKNVFKVGNIIKISEGSYNPTYNSATINEIELVKEAKNGLDKEEREEKFKFILEAINEFKDENLKSSILAVIFEAEEVFKISPAAVTMHHNYIGGLVQHISECIEFAKLNAKGIKKQIDLDLVLAGCIMHDIAKMFEYEVDENGIISKDKEFQKKWINHIHWGFSWANQNGLPELAHIIASHHGLRDWGALVEPLTDEAHLVHQVDMISSRLGSINVNDL